MEYKKYALKTGNLYTIKTDKFRTVNIEINFKCDIRNCNVTCQNLLSRLMGYTSNDYKTKREMMIKREELYNLDCSRQISRRATLFLLLLGPNFRSKICQRRRLFRKCDYFSCKYPSKSSY